MVSSVFIALSRLPALSGLHSLALPVRITVSSWSVCVFVVFTAVVGNRLGGQFVSIADRTTGGHSVFVMVTAVIRGHCVLPRSVCTVSIFARGHYRALARSGICLSLAHSVIAVFISHSRSSVFVSTARTPAVTRTGQDRSRSACTGCARRWSSVTGDWLADCRWSRQLSAGLHRRVVKVMVRFAVMYRQCITVSAGGHRGHLYHCVFVRLSWSVMVINGFVLVRYRLRIRSVVIRVWFAHWLSLRSLHHCNYRIIGITAAVVVHRCIIRGYLSVVWSRYRQYHRTAVIAVSSVHHSAVRSVCNTAVTAVSQYRRYRFAVWLCMVMVTGYHRIHCVLAG
jgi:hypothetical protein